MSVNQYCDLPDEALLGLYRFGDDDARNVLVERYAKKSGNYARLVSPGIVSNLDEGEINHASFIAYLSAENGYHEGSGTFRNYYLAILSHELSKVFKESPLFESWRFVSLDSNVPGTEGESTFHDVIASGEENDPRCFLDYMEEALTLGKLPSILDQTTLKVARLHIDGETFEGISHLVNLSPKQARTRFLQYDSFIKDGIKFGSFEVALAEHAKLLRKGPASTKRGKRKK
jgi:hypothetical protein